ncbi:hypothetical protein ACIRVK_35320 [Streptomyces sp. NPDC101152]|uniref:hypothetical protein n=1 Tax=Streptomyces sp. NPDC101152 TaxID=3366116 RepID=UPI003816317B
MAACTDPIGAVVGWTDLTAPGIAPEPARLRALLGGEFLAGIRRQVRLRWIRLADPRPDVLRALRGCGRRGTPL